MVNPGSWKCDVRCLGILVGVSLLIGVYEVRKSALINPDGVFYISLAQRLPGDSVGVARTHPPGYPFLLWAAHAAATRLVGHDSSMLWLYSALSVTLLCRVLALIPLYFLGRLLVGAADSFWAVLILSFLPYPTQYAADVLREWPYVVFLGLGFWLLCWALRRRQWWALALVGLDAGLGYLIRPECGQLVLYALLGLIFLGFAEKTIRQLTLSGAGLLAIAGFLVPVAPYVHATGAIAPHQFQPPAAMGPPTISAIGSKAASDDPLEFQISEGELLELPIRASDALGAPLTLSLAGVPVGSRPVYEFRSPVTGSRVWTASEYEKYVLLSTYSREVWDWEGIVCYAYAQAEARAGLQGVSRFWSPTRMRHFYTIDAQEKEALLARPVEDAWLSEGVVFYVWPEGNQPPRTVPVYRFGSREPGYAWAIKGSAAYQAVSADDAQTGTVVWYVHQGGAPPAGATIEGGVFRWRPSRGQRGEYQINIIGSDGQLESCQLVILRVTAGPSARAPLAPLRAGTCSGSIAHAGPDRSRERAASGPVQHAGIGMLPEAAHKIVTGIAEDLMVVFFVPWLLGLFWRLRYEAERAERVLITAVVVLNIALILGRHLGFGPGDDRRYALGMIALTIFYVPVGMNVVARWLNSIRPLPWFHLLIAVGLVACLPKLLLASPGTKVGYRAAAAWLQQNTRPNDVLAVPDIRISFYAQRQGLLYVQHPNSRRADYVIVIDDGAEHQIPEEWRREYSVMVDRRTRKTLGIYSTARLQR